MTTTVSARSRLSNSLAQTKARCSDLPNSHEIGTQESAEDGLNHSNVGDDLAFEDEEIASIEADGASGMDVPDDEGPSEKQLLTAALVTSIVELAGTSPCSAMNTVDVSGREGSSAETRRRSSRKLKECGGTEREGDSLSGNVSLAPRGTPSIEAISETLNNQTAGRTIYKRASKSAASEKVASVLVSHSRTNANENATPVAKKRKLNSDCAAGTAQPSKASLLEHSSSSAATSAAGFMHGADNGPPKLAHNQSPMHTRDSKANASLVPNPLAGTQGSTFMHSLFPTPGSKGKDMSKKTNSLMSAAPALVCSSNPSSRMQLGGQLANNGESVSSQHYQTNGLTASNCVNEVAPQVRGRIFSIDLDPAVLDFVENVVDPLSDKTYVSTIEPPGGTEVTSDAKNPSVTFKEGSDNNVGRVPLRRDRGFSFEFFSFGINEDEPLPPVPASICGAHIPQGNRLRGDSIIFDPTSFREGGIHETSALLCKQENEDQNIEGIPNAPVPQIAHAAPSSLIKTGSCPIPTEMLASKGSVKAAPGTSTGYPASHSRLRAKTRHAMPPIYGELNKSPAPPISAVDPAVSSRNIPQPFSDNTLHMPHGSDAAAAAAVGVPQTSPSMPNEGFSISHTACSMDLLNKGGRIGIYLPEERKARIAKFHSKRKIRIWRKRIKYDCRKKLADSRPRIKGRFVKRSDVDGESSLYSLNRGAEE